MEDVVVRAAPPPVLPASATLVGEAVEVTFCSSTSSEVTLMFEPGRHDPDDILIVGVDESGILRPLSNSYSGDDVAVVVTTSGTFAAIALVPPDGCEAGAFRYGVTANSNAELAELDGMTRLDGDLTLGGAVSSLDSLDCLTWIGGKLTVAGTTMLTDLELGALGIVWDGISVSSNANLERVSLPSLLFTGEVFSESLFFEDLAKLGSVDLSSLMNAQGAVEFETIGGETSEPLVLDLKRLASIDGTLRMNEVHNLRSVDLRSLRALATWGGLFFANLPELTHLDLRSVIEIPRGLFLSWLGSLASSPLVLDLRSLETVGYDLILEYVYNLENLDTLQRLERVSGNVAISYSNLIQVDGFANLREVSGDVRFDHDELLRSIDLRSLHTEPSGTSLEFMNLPQLRTIDSPLVQDAQGVRLLNVGGEADAPLTVNLTALTSVGVLSLNNAPNLRDLSGFIALREIRSVLEIRSNASITSLRDLGELTRVNREFLVTDNAALPTCEARWLLDHLETQPEFVIVSGNLSDACE